MNPAPNDHHRQLARLAGTLVGEEHMEPSPWVPEGHVAEGTYENVVVAGGLALATTYFQKKDGEITYSGHGFTVWEAERETYAMYWTDSIGTPVQVWRGVFEGDELVLEGDSEHGRLRHRWRIVGETQETSSERSTDGGETWEFMHRATYHRVEATGDQDHE